jgi:hypothetical protein
MRLAHAPWLVGLSILCSGCALFRDAAPNAGPGVQAVVEPQQPAKASIDIQHQPQSGAITIINHVPPEPVSATIGEGNKDVQEPAPVAIEIKNNPPVEDSATRLSVLELPIALQQAKITSIGEPAGAPTLPREPRVIAAWAVRIQKVDELPIPPRTPSVAEPPMPPTRVTLKGLAEPPVPPTRAGVARVTEPPIPPTRPGITNVSDPPSAPTRAGITTISAPHKQE